MESARTARMDDGERVASLRREARDALVGARGADLLMGTRGTGEPPWSTLISDPTRLALVGTLEHHVVGYGLARLVPVEGRGLLGVVDEVWVEAGARGVGVGEALMTSIMEWCAHAGCFGVDGEALPGDRMMKAFFERFGMSARLLVMHRRLPGPHPAR